MEFANRMFDEEVKRERGQERDYSHAPARPTPPLQLSAYAGKYANDFFGPIELAEKQGKLVLRLGPQPLEFDLRHWDRDVFIYQPVGESAGGLSGVRFSIDPGGEADRVLVENLNIHGQGSFTRVEMTRPALVRDNSPGLGAAVVAPRGLNCGFRWRITSCSATLARAS